MNVATSKDNEKLRVAETFRTLLAELNLTPQEVSRRSRGRIRDNDVYRVQNGRSTLQEYEKRQVFARALGVSFQAFSLLLDGKIDVRGALAMSNSVNEEDTPLFESEARIPVALSNLELCVQYHERCGKSWRPGSIAAARAHESATRGTEWSPTQWAAYLDRMDALAAEIDGPVDETAERSPDSRK